MPKNLTLQMRLLCMECAREESKDEEVKWFPASEAHRIN